jgi:enoyl-CoA hydratase/carnithine racemase
MNVFQNTRKLTEMSELRGNVVYITFNRPDKANALNRALLTSILEAFDAAEAEPEARAIVMRGDGRHFCAGADLTELLAGGPPGIRKLLNLFREVTRRIEASHLAVVAAVHGAAKAGGLEIMLACDAVVAASGASIGDAHVLQELIPGGGSSVRLPRTIGHQRAKWMILSGDSIDETTAKKWGLVHEVCDQSALIETALVVAKKLTRADHSTFARAKKLVSNSAVLGFGDA